MVCGEAVAVDGLFRFGARRGTRFARPVRVIRKSGIRLCEKIMLQQKAGAAIGSV